MTTNTKVAIALSLLVTLLVGAAAGALIARNTLPTPVKFSLVHDNGFGRYDPGTSGFISYPGFGMERYETSYTVSLISEETAKVLQWTESPGGFAIEVHAKPNQLARVKVTVQDGRGSSATINWTKKAPSTIGHKLTPPAISVQVQQLDAPQIKPNCLFQITPTLGPGEDPNSVRTLSAWDFPKWGVGEPKIVNQGSQDLNLFVDAVDSSDPIRPEGSTAVHLSCITA